MDLLEFARGPGLIVSVAVFVLGTAWRLISVFRLPRLPDLSPAREGAPSPLRGALRANLRAMWPRAEFRPAVLATTINSYVLHIGLALVVLGYAPHIEFVRRHTGIGWPALPDTVMYLAAAATICGMAVLMFMNDDSTWLPSRSLITGPPPL